MIFLIERNLNPTGRISNMLFGLAAIGDGLVRTLSLGFLHTRWTLQVSGWQMKMHLKQRRKEASHAQSH